MENCDTDLKTKCKANTDLELLISSIQSRDSSFLQKLLEESVDILNHNNDGWYPLHEAVNLGYTEIVQQIVKYASKHGVNVLKKWDQATTSHSNHSTDMFNVGFSYSCWYKTQTSFLTLSVQTRQLDMIKLFIELHKKEIKPHFSLRRSLQIRKMNVSQVTQVFLHRVLQYNRSCNYIVSCFNFANAGIFKAIFESISRPEILQILIEAFPEYVVGRYYKCQVINYALRQNEFESINALITFMCNLHYDLKKKGMCIPKAFRNMVESCMKWTCKNDDTRVLNQLIDAAGGKKLLNLNTKDSDYFVMYYILHYSCLSCTVKVVKFLVEFGFNIYEDYYCEHSLPNSCTYNEDFYDIFQAHDLRQRRCGSSNVSNRSHISAISYAAIGNNNTVLKYLLAVVDKEKLFKLHFCCPFTYLYMTQNYWTESVHLLLEAGFFTDIFYLSKCWGGKTFLDCCVYDFKDASIEMLKLLIKSGAVDLAFGKHRTIAPFKQYLLKRWNDKYAQLKQHNLEFPVPEHFVLTEESFESVNNTRLTKKFDIFLQCVSCFKISGGESIYLEEIIPSLKQLCRYLIRCCVIHKYRTLQYMHELPLPAILRDYLFSCDL